MYLSEITKEDEIIAAKLLSRLDIGEKECYIKGENDKKFEKIVLKKIYKSDDNKGIFICYLYDNRVRIMISFENDIWDKALLEEMECYLSKIKEKYQKHIIEMGLNSENINIVKCFNENHELNLKWEGFELTHFKKDFENNAFNRDLVSKAYEPKYIMDYLDLLDKAFVNIAPPDAFKNDRNDMEKLLEGKNEEFEAFWIEDELIGLYYTDKELLDVIAVNPDYQSKGYGAYILNHCLNNVFNKRNLDKVYLYVVEKNVGAKRFYLNNGFSVSGHAKFLSVKSV